MKYDDISMDRFLNVKETVFDIPLFQRNYDWETPQLNKFLEDIHKIIDIDNNNNESQNKHFFGTIYLIEKESLDFTRNMIVDGQQRITTVILFLKAIFDSTQDLDLKSEIWNNYIYVKQDKNKMFRLNLSKIDSEIYSKIMQETITCDLANNNCKLSKAYYHLKANLKQKEFKYPLDKCFKSLKKLLILSIKLDRNEPSENPQIIFENINSTGVRLKESDLIRNFLLFSCDPEEQDAWYEKYWYKMEGYFNYNSDTLDDFLNAFTTIKRTKSISKDSYYLDLKTYVLKQINLGFLLEDTMKDLIDYAKQYSYIIGLNNHENSDINNILIELNSLDTTTIHPILIFLLFQHESNSANFTSHQLVQCLNLILSYVYRILVCKKDSKYIKPLLDVIILYNKLEVTDKQYYLKYYITLAKKLCDNSSDNGFPVNTSMEESFLEENFPKKLRLYTLKKIFKKITNAEIEDLTIEHIMPQNLSFEWDELLGKNCEELHELNLNRIGNLTLLTQSENSKLQDKSFERKRDLYKTSIWEMNRRISEFTSWNDKKIKELGKIYYEYALDIWPLPDEYESIISEKEQLNCDKTYDFRRSFEVKTYKPVKLIVNKEEIKIKHWNLFFNELILICKKQKQEDFKKLIDESTFPFLSNVETSNCKVEICDGLYRAGSITTSTEILKCCVNLATTLDIAKDIQFKIKYASLSQ